MCIAVVIHRQRVDGHAAAALAGLIAETKTIEILLAGDHAIRHRGLQQRLEINRGVGQVAEVRRHEQHYGRVTRGLGDRPLHAISICEVLLRQRGDILLIIARGVSNDLDFVRRGRSASIRSRCQVHIVDGIILIGLAGHRDVSAQRQRFDVVNLLRRDVLRGRSETAIGAVEHARHGVHVASGRRIRPVPADRRVVVR